MNKNFYVFEYYDSACPSICTFYKKFMGTFEEVDYFVKLCKKNGNLPEIVNAFEKYKYGKYDVSYNLLKECIFTQAEIIEELPTAIYRNVEWEYTNIYGFPYYLKCDKLVIKRKCVKISYNVFTVKSCSFSNLYYKSIIGNSYILLSQGFWGLPNFFRTVRNDKGDCIIKCNLWTIEEDSDIKKDPYKLKNIIDEVFADG